MFHVKRILDAGQCLMCGRTGEVLEIEAPDQRITGCLCLGDFKKLVRVATASKTIDKSQDEIRR